MELEKEGLKVSNERLSHPEHQGGALRDWCAIFMCCGRTQDWCPGLGSTVQDRHGALGVNPAVNTIRGLELLP